MNKKELDIVIDVIGLITAYGIPYTARLIETWEDEREVTPAMIMDLVNSMSDPNTLFKDDE